jgi:hypothetical protein
MRNLSTRVGRLEATAPGALTVCDAIDRPPQETREEWIARQAGNPLPGALNSRGETREQWTARSRAELEGC